MNGKHQLLFVLGCVVCLLAVASALPAADPRLAPPGGDESAAGDWESIDGTPSVTPDPVDDEMTDSRDSDDETSDSGSVRDPAIEIDGALEPGNEVRIEVDSASPFSEREVEVEEESIGYTDWGRIDATVPYTDEMTVSVPEDNTSRTVDVETNATIEFHDGAAPTADFELSAEVGSMPLEAGTVYVDGEEAATTDEDGFATVTLPERAGPADISVERGPVAGERTVEVAEPTVGFVSQFLFPGSPAPVQVSADGTPVPDATIELEDGESETTGDDGRAIVWLPIDDSATVTATVGEESTMTTVENLYLRLAALVVLVPGFVVGGVVTYVRLAARTDGRGIGLNGTFVALANVLSGVSDVLARSGGAFSRAVDAFEGAFAGLRDIHVPSVSLPRFDLVIPERSGRGLPSIGPALSSFGSAFGSVSLLGSLFEQSIRSGDSRTESGFLEDLFAGDESDDEDDEDDEDEPEGTEPATLADESLAPRGPRAEIRTAWHAFLDRIVPANRETLTPGQAARHALAAGFPSEQVARLVSIVRDVEYGNRDPSPERVLEARETATDLIEHDDREDDSTEGSE
ncbi:DUF4129 domain-containing protein [Natronobacterium texcoconense]|uniref:Protein-glutamine gamma-glutamyltransferase-like C-terminal domain-containing protein n=1 Tax=Natronobacterium texcoconense TaxID=1095778 RepID=A0A1H0ZHG3_NATTX|nr:DUF4129 domain-containing protein [Natronobacterium texcoconense]SDQ26804.1 protein of unknown function [Natronobacterium texcoconense]